MELNFNLSYGESQDLEVFDETVQLSDESGYTETQICMYLQTQMELAVQGVEGFDGVESTSLGEFAP